MLNGTDTSRRDDGRSWFGYSPESRDVRPIARVTELRYVRSALCDPIPATTGSDASVDAPAAALTAEAGSRPAGRRGVRSRAQSPSGVEWVDGRVPSVGGGSATNGGIVLVGHRAASIAWGIRPALAVADIAELDIHVFRERLEVRQARPLTTVASTRVLHVGAAG